MRNIYFFLTAFALSFTLQAQIINIPDTNFKNALVNTICANTEYGSPNVNSDVDLNNDGEIQVSEAESIYYLDVSNQSISSLEGIEYFINLYGLSCDQNQITELDLSAQTNLGYLDCGFNQLAELNITNLSLIHI